MRPTCPASLRPPPASPAVSGDAAFRPFSVGADLVRLFAAAAGAAFTSGFLAGLSLALWMV